MNMTEYLVASGRTCADVFHSDKVAPQYVSEHLTKTLARCESLDRAKKALFYGRENLMWTTEEGEYDYQAAYDGLDPNIIHALLGVITEAGELGELLRDAIHTGTGVDRVKLMDESGDVLWYLALLFRSIETDFDEVGERNIHKLMIRFPDKFTQEAVNNKDHEAENAAFVTKVETTRGEFLDVYTK